MLATPSTPVCVRQNEWETSLPLPKCTRSFLEDFRCKRVFRAPPHTLRYTMRSYLSTHETTSGRLIQILCIYTCMCLAVDERTCQDSTGDARNALDLSHIVGCKVFVAGRVEERRIAKHAPQLGGDRPISRLNGLGTHIKCFPHQSAVTQDTNTGDKKSSN